jgi:hypothetical protein
MASIARLTRSLAVPCMIVFTALCASKQVRVNHCRSLQPLAVPGLPVARQKRTPPWMWSRAPVVVAADRRACAQIRHCQRVAHELWSAEQLERR